MILGVISAIDSTKGLTVVVDGEEIASTKKYSYLASYVPTAGDKVVIEEISDSYVILGKIVTKVADSGNVRYADTASTADTAATATTATTAQTANVALQCSGNASTATYATSAGSATTATTAAKATTAESCTGNAATATSAGKCTGNAATATVSNATKGFDSSFTNYESGKLVTSVTREWNSTLNKYIVTDVATTFSNHYFTYK